MQLFFKKNDSRVSLKTGMDRSMEGDWKNGIFDFCIDRRRV